MNILIIEDEDSARRKLISYLNEFGATFNIVAEIESVAQLIDFLKKEISVDLIFADIELRDGNIFNAFDKVNIPAPVVFVTAYNQYALNAFEANGIEYLLKPFSYERFTKCMDKIQNIKSQEIHFTKEVINRLLVEINNKKNYKQRFIIKKGKNIHILIVDNISFFEFEKGLIFAFDEKGEKFIVNETTLNDIEKQLDPAFFSE